MEPAPRSAVADPLSALIEAFAPRGGVPSAPAVLQARRNAVARAEFLERHGAIEPKAAVRQAGYRTKNPSEQVSRWLAAGKLFAVEWGGQKLLPAFQFDAASGQPRPEVARLLEVLGDRRRGWEIALWMSAPNGWLRGRRPLELWPGEIDEVLAAARAEVAPVGA